MTLRRPQLNNPPRLPRLVIAVLTVALGCLVSAGSATALPGDLDSGFGSGGTAVLPSVTFSGTTSDVVRQADGRLVVGGTAEGENPPGTPATVFLVARYNANGTLDTSFGGGDGVVLTPVGVGNASLTDLLIQPDDGKIVAVGGAVQELMTGGFKDAFAAVR